MSKINIPSLREILELINDMNNFSVEDYIISTTDGKYQLDIESLIKSNTPIKMFAIDDENQFIRFEFENGQVATLNPEGDSWSIKGHAPSTFVYLISDSTGLTKIGISNNPKDRVRMLQTSSSAKLKLLDFWKCKNALEVEKYLHKVYKTLRVNGEWFRLSTNDIDDIRKYFDGIK